MSTENESVVASLGLRDDPAPADGEGTGTGAASAPSGRNFEEEASIKGWVPQDQFSGDPSKWVDAETFVKRGERFTNNLQREVEALKRQVANFEGTKKQFQKHFEEVVARKNAEIDAAIREARLQRAAALREGEDEAVLALEDRIEDLRTQKQETSKAVEDGQHLDPAATDPTSNPILQEWIEDGNEWFNDDPALRDYALQIGEAMNKAGNKLRGRPFLDAVAKEMRTHFPRKFAKHSPQGAQDSRVNTGSRSSAPTPSAHGRSKADLPEEDRRLMEQGIREGWFKDEKTFLDSYFGRP